MEKSYPLHKAIRYRIASKIRILLKTIDINTKNEFGKPALVYACEQQHNDEMLEILFEQENIDPFCTDDEYQNAVHVLAFNGQLKWIKRFFEKFPKVSVDEVTIKQDTALIIAAKMNQVDIINYLCKREANINHRNDKNFTALHYAANNDHSDTVRRLIDLGAHVNVFDDRGCTPLMKTCSWGFIEPCKILLENGAEMEPKARKVHYTALIQAIQRGHLEILQLLLENGANPNYKYTEQKIYLLHTPLGCACARQNVEAMKLLIKFGADVNDGGKFSNALFICVKKGFEEGVKILLETEVNLNGRHSQSNLTVLETARRLGKKQILELLERHVQKSG